jgi:hypothetical protein
MNVDKELSKIGFVKTGEDHFCATYERKNEEEGYVQCLDLIHKASGKHLIQSYQEDVNTDKFNNMVGLTMYEARLALRKMKQMGWKEIR